MTEQMAVLRQDYGPAELAEVTAPHGITKTVVVQARQSLAETDWLLAVADSSPLIAAVVGWVDLADRAVGEQLQTYARRVVGVRHVVQDEADGFLDAAPFNRGVSNLAEHGLLYDLLIYPHQLEETIRFVDRHPEQPFVLDHAAKPRIGERYDAEWDRLIRRLAERPHVTCKFSGLATGVQTSSWDVDQLRPYWETLLEAFTPSRLMFGSDWPVARLASEYDRWVTTVRTLAGSLSPEEQQHLFNDTAARTYRLADAT